MGFDLSFDWTHHFEENQVGMENSLLAGFKSLGCEVVSKHTVPHHGVLGVRWWGRGEGRRKRKGVGQGRGGENGNLHDVRKLIAENKILSKKYKFHT